MQENSYLQYSVQSDLYKYSVYIHTYKPMKDKVWITHGKAGSGEWENGSEPDHDWQPPDL